ncbi:MAG TPA: shikimate kinase [Actinomycetota bacterium]|nr:shikimate kinase [Actinomycetota bacterium]
MTIKGRRISVIGSSGAGKTTVGRRIAQLLNLPFIEMDEIRHGPNWSEIPNNAFRLAIADRVIGDEWVVDGNYASIVREAVWSRADTVVWLDLDRPLVMWQVISRSLSRAAWRGELWSGNREQFRRWIRPDHPIRWAWSAHASKRTRDQAQLTDPRWVHLEVVRLRTRADVRTFLAALEGQAGNRSV